MENKNRDYHFFASDFIFDRVNVDTADDTSSLKNIEKVTWKNFVPSTEEDQLYKQSLKVLLGRIMAKYVSKFQWMKSILPTHIPHTFDDVMSQRSDVCWLPVMLKNEAFYSDCIHIMKAYESQVIQWYTKSGRACDQQSKLYKRFYKTSSGRDKGTLFNLKLNIERSNVNGNVKSRFEAHEDFVLTVGNAYFLSFVMHKFGMDSLDAEPKHPLLKTNIKYMHNKQTEDIFEHIISEIIQDLLCIFPKEEPCMLLNVEVLNTSLLVESQWDEGILKFTLRINNNNIIFNVTPEQAKRGQTIDLTVCGKRVPVRVTQTHSKAQDDLYNYVMQFLQWFFIILTFKDAIKEGDSDRTNITLKFCIPVFFGHSVLSKYLEECIDYILKTEIVLSQKMSLKVRYGSFVNMTGNKGENKATDMQKENEVLVLKELIRGLGSNKTEKAIISITKAAPVIQNIVTNFDKMVNIYDKHTYHKKRSMEGDISVLMKKLIPLNIWTPTPGRTLENFQKIKKSPHDIDRAHFKGIIMGKVNRLKRGIPVPTALSDDSDSEKE
ncbi:uncharacterized protein [Argopecten irradians]|uniref:uncharacterized protein n=1 Tax=Argopecten irradians TaxID=31199 RepID=UPI00371D72EF